MQRTGSKVQEAVESREVSKALEKTSALTSDEEKVLRMRHGAKVDTRRTLERHGEGNAELQDELLLMEMQLFRAYRAHLAQQARKAAQPSRTKDKIVRALRKKH
jgi:hypothetical protein